MTYIIDARCFIIAFIPALYFLQADLDHIFALHYIGPLVLSFLKNQNLS